MKKEKEKQGEEIEIEKKMKMMEKKKKKKKVTWKSRGSEKKYSLSRFALKSWELIGRQDAAKHSTDRKKC